MAKRGEKAKPSQIRKPNTKWHKRFLELLRATRNVSQSAIAAGTSRETAFAHRRRFPAFARAWEAAYQHNIDDLEATFLKRAIEGWWEEVWERDKKTGKMVCVKRVQKHSDVLQIFALKAWRRERYLVERLQSLEGGSAEEIGKAMAAFVKEARAMTSGDKPDETVDTS